MSKKWSLLISILSIAAYVGEGFKPFQLENHNWFTIDDNDKSVYCFPSQNQNDYINLNIPFTGKFFVGFKEAIAFKESQCQYKRVNESGCMGKYQFNSETLKSVGIDNHSSFLNSPKLQEKAFVALLSKNKWELKDEIEKFSGRIIGGIKVTESGILAAAHLGGVRSVRKFLNSCGKRKCKDGNGASIGSYMHDFGGYETSAIVANSDAKAL